MIRTDDYRPHSSREGWGKASTVLIFDRLILGNEYMAVELLAHRLDKEFFKRSRTESICVVHSARETVVLLRYFPFRHDVGFYDKVTRRASRLWDQLEKFI